MARPDRSVDPWPKLPVKASQSQPFVKPAKTSKAIPIIDPHSREERPAQSPTSSVRSQPDRPTVTLTEKAQAQRKAAVAARGQIESGKAVAAPAKHSPAGSRSSSNDDDFERRGFDIYATPFVPEKIKVINTLPGRLVATPPSRDLDLHTYSLQSLGSRLLPHLSLDSTYSYQACVRDPPSLTPLSYERFFRFHLDEEIQHQQRENASYSLYAHEVTVDFRPNGQARLVAQVPGLRENSPYVEEDDVVQLRQLRFDSAGRLLEGPGPGGALIDPVTGYYLPVSPWTEIIYDARVTAVTIAMEQVVLDVFGLTPHTTEIALGLHHGQAFDTQQKLKLNIQFLLPLDRYWPMQQALPQIQASLVRARGITSQVQAMNGNIEAPSSMVNAFWIQSMLFPTEADCRLQANAHSGVVGQDLYDRLLNLEQRIAVENICGQNYGVLPYLISGPPGTGKTKTMIEIALQLVNNVHGVSHILLCAPSEQAADTLADRLRSYLKPSEMLRLNRPTRTFGEVPDTILQYCHIIEGRFHIPAFEQLMSYKIVITSCRDARMLMQCRMTNTDLYAVEYGLRARIHPEDPPPTTARLHWDALLIDEAAQATEPEALIPLLVVAPPPDAPQLLFTPLLVMAGDERQLNPRTSSPNTPLKRSLFARLFSRPVYASHPLARHFRAHNGAPATAPITIEPSMVPVLRPAFTNLIRNYRSHPAILAVPSSLFYSNTLVPEADPASTNRLQSWSGWARTSGLKSPYMPVLFHNNTSPDDLERDGGGWFNRGETQIACEYASKLIKSGLLSESEVCIMSPFKAQVRRIRQLIRSEKFRHWGVNVGPTEAYQGLEHGVVILCVTRSRRRFVHKDKELGWGIVGMPNQMNVALTRAKAGLIVLGSRKLMVEEDENWKAFVGFCERNGLVVGEKE
ncbi:P-loop containing nucleoside triphosphate hydrolase protein [Cercophora newfieldiana]|uniref:P-loop containing nucleoside triphosphate hydrolase protein n=1 Tax=Cercophora newfieldiana TaxID=92897 RepID=A0AA39XSP8_9PEZI|nr:P-loop containing nucleoside triphosphate hydrolase protein [Cercophora newfieldiana]